MESWLLRNVRFYLSFWSFYVLKKFSRDILQSEDDSSIVITSLSKINTYITRKILLSKTFQIHCPSSFSKVFYYFFFVAVLLKGEQRLLKKRETQQISTPIRIRSNIFLIRHAVMSCYYFAHFQDWKSSGLVFSSASFSNKHRLKIWKDEDNIRVYTQTYDDFL